MLNRNKIQLSIPNTVSQALNEDIGTGDISAQLIPVEQHANAQIISREQAILCGTDWVNEVFYQVDPSISLKWHLKDGDLVAENQPIFNAQGSTAKLLTAERTALNFLQLLSGTASISNFYANLVKGTEVKLLDTRKTIPGLRLAQKYAVSCGGCYNHRIGLYDAFLIKENHIMACGGIGAAIQTAKKHAPDKPVEIEVENIDELEQALAAKSDIIMLDNFSLKDLKQAVQLTASTAKLEASGGITTENLRQIAETGVDYISIGALTKNCSAVDLSMRLITE